MMGILRWVVVAFGIVGVACSARSAPGAGETDRAAPPERGLALAAYSGVFAEHPRLRRAVERMPEALVDARREVSERLGLALDPDRPRRVVLVDRDGELGVTSRVVAGRRVQEIPVAAGPLAQGRRTVEAAARMALARGALADPEMRHVPDWFAKGAPLWVAGEWERVLHERLLRGAEMSGEPANRVPPIRLDGGESDPVSAALFVRFLAVEFGADRVADLGHAFSAGGGAAESLRAALRTDPSSVPTAFEGFALRAASEILEDPYVRELFAVRGLLPGERIVRLTGLEERVEDPWVAAAVLEERSLAEYESGDYESALGTLAQIERDHALHALALDRDRFLYAMCFLRRGEREAGALRLRAFISEFPESVLVTEARFRLGEVLLATGRAEDAMVEFRIVASGAPPGPMRARSAVALGAYETARYRYAAARDWLRLAPGSDEARRLAGEIEAQVGRGLPPGGVSLVREAVKNLRSDEAERAERGERVLLEVGELAAPTVLLALSGKPEEWPAGLAGRALRLASDWETPAGDGILLRLLAVSEGGIGPEALDELAARGRSADSLFPATPEDGPAREHWEARFGAGRLPQDVLADLESDDWEARVRGAERLSRIPGTYAGRRLNEMAGDESPQVRAAVAGFLGRRGGENLSGALFALTSDESPLVRARAYAAAGSRADWALVRHGMGDDPDPGVRTECARLFLDSGREEAAAAVVALLADPEPEVRAVVEPMLRSSRASGIDDALAEALPEAEAMGHAMRLVRIMADRVGSDFGYDPDGGAEERRRVAEAFRERIRTGSGN